ncbi:MAG: MlaD family protein [Bacteroidota bacterium]
MTENNKNIKLGLFIITGSICLILALYFIGRKQNLFGDTFQLKARFYNVNGLMKGNSVRFAGIDVGTVESIRIINDTTVCVTMLIENDVREFIKKDAVASIGTDGLMGNKLVNIKTGAGHSGHAAEGDELQTVRSVEMDEMMGSLSITNENMKVITSSLRNITDKLSSENNLWSLLNDAAVAENIKASLVNLKLTSNQAVLITGDLSYFTRNIKNGKGSLGALITDTVLSSRLTQTVVRMERISDTAAILSGDISEIVKNVKQGKGSMGVLLNDTTFIHNLNKSLTSFEKGAGNFNENMEAVKLAWPFKKYFRKQKNKK